MQLLHALHFLQAWMQNNSLNAPSEIPSHLFATTRLSQAPATTNAQTHATQTRQTCCNTMLMTMCHIMCYNICL
jgi:hypothetical protein